jgi:AraC-like DNA-binding protein/quercetin dioxygenase-like cupin family protein
MAATSPNNLHVSNVTHLRFHPDWKTPEHFHADHYEMILILEGEIEVRIRGQVLHCPANGVLVYPRGVPHEEHAVGGPLHMLLAVWAERKQSRAPKPWPLISKDSRGRIRQSLEWLREVPASDHTTQSSLLHCALAEFARGADLPPDDPMRRVQHHIHQNFAQKITLADLAKIAHQSPYHFARLFHQRTGQPPMRYLRQVRVEAAKTLVVTSPLPLRAVASMTGLVDEFHLSRVFRAVTGHPPSELRRQPPAS